MRRVLAVLTGLLGVAVVPLALSAATSWMAILGHLALSAACVGLSITDGAGGRPMAARGWGVFHLCTTAGIATALHAASWTRGGWGWTVPLFAVLLWAWIPPIVAFASGAVAQRQAAWWARRTVARRHAALAAQQPRVVTDRAAS